MAKDKMGACMSEWKDKHPHGRAKERMSKKNAQKQAVAACLNKTGVNEDLNLTFKSFLNEEAMDVRQYIRSLPMYQELIKDPQHKPAAMTLARSFVNEFGQQGADRNVQAYINDEFDDMYRTTIGKQGHNVGDWKGEQEYQDRMQQDKDIASAMDKWEQTTGMDAETGAEVSKYDDRGRLKHGARSGMDFRPEIKQQRIAAELQGLGDERDVIQKRAAAGPAAGDAAYAGGESKASRAAQIVSAGISAGKKPREIKAELRNTLDMTAAGANTYYYKYKAQALANQG